MYLIRLASGREAAFATIQELALAIQRGDVDRDALIFHRRTGEWLPIERHPQFFAQAASGTPRAAGDPATLAPVQDREPIAPTPLAPPVVPLPRDPAVLRPAPPTPTPAFSPPPPPAPTAPEPEVRPRAGGRLHDDAGARVPAGPGRGRRLAMLIGSVVIVGGLAAGVVIGWQLRPRDGDAEAAPGYQPAPAPSSLVRPEAGRPDPVRRGEPPAIRRASGDPLAPVSAEVLAARHARTFAFSQDQLAAELGEVGLDGLFGVRSFATPEGARAARRTVASALNVLGQFHRREVMIDQAYRDTAAFQTTRAGWSRAERDGWDARPSLREAYAAADLAESLLADADSLLAILAGSESYVIRGDTIHFGSAAVAASYHSQRQRIAQRSGEPVGDPDRRPTLAQVRRSVDPLRLPEGAP